MIQSKLVFSTSTSGSGEIATSNKRFNNKVKILTIKSKSDKAREQLNALFNI